MSTMNHPLDLEEQIYYVQCGYCTTILLVNVPCSSLCSVVTVRCGHCTGFLSVNMMRTTSLLPLHLLASLNQDELSSQPKIDNIFPEKVDAPKATLDDIIRSPSPIISSDDYEDDDLVYINHIVNKPPEKRQRAPSAYNCFIKDEIKRLKTMYPNMAHKQAFSTAAKNWAHFPPSQQNEGGAESCSQGENKFPRCSDVDEQAHAEGSNFHERLQGIQFGQGHPLNEGSLMRIYQKRRVFPF